MRKYLVAYSVREPVGLREDITMFGDILTVTVDATCAYNAKELVKTQFGEDRCFDEVIAVSRLDD